MKKVIWIVAIVGYLALPTTAPAQDYRARVQGSVADESGGGEPAATAFLPGAATILTGPEGGFIDQERSSIAASANVVPLSLGPRILRAETAALAALAAYMTVVGDWRNPED